MGVYYTVLSPTERIQFSDRYGLEDPDFYIRQGQGLFLFCKTPGPG
jgi:hypothetical protein